MNKDMTTLPPTIVESFLRRCSATAESTARPISVLMESSLYEFRILGNTKLPDTLHRFEVMANCYSNFRWRQGSASL